MSYCVNFYRWIAGSISIFSFIAHTGVTLAATPQSLTLSPEDINDIKALITTPTPASTETGPSIISDDVQNQANTIEDPVTSVSQLSDVSPNDWAFQALQSLIEHYGCITGEPIGVYRGNRALTRYEFAAGLNTCLDKVRELIATGTANLIQKEDLAKLQKLQEQFGSELVALRGRINTEEVQIAELESQQFSTTTKLSGQAIFAVGAGGFSGDRIVDPKGAEITTKQPNTTFFYRAAVDLNTSFTGTDLLKLRLDTVSGLGKDHPSGFLEPNFGSVLEYTIRGTPNNQLGVSRLYYSFNPTKNLRVTLGPSLVATDYIDLNNYASGIIDFSTYSLVNNFLLFPINAPSAGAVVDWNPGKGPFKLRALYVAADAANPNRSSASFVPGVFPASSLLYPRGGGSRGLFGDPYQGTVELEYSPSKTFA
ncbi:iron uptake porin, partial [Aetokthonos hydrillicola]